MARPTKLRNPPSPKNSTKAQPKKSIKAGSKKPLKPQRSLSEPPSEPSDSDDSEDAYEQSEAATEEEEEESEEEKLVAELDSDNLDESEEEEEETPRKGGKRGGAAGGSAKKGAPAKKVKLDPDGKNTRVVEQLEKVAGPTEDRQPPPLRHPSPLSPTSHADSRPPAHSQDAAHPAINAGLPAPTEDARPQRPRLVPTARSASLSSSILDRPSHHEPLTRIVSEIGSLPPRPATDTSHSQTRCTGTRWPTSTLSSR